MPRFDVLEDPRGYSIILRWDEECGVWHIYLELAPDATKSKAFTIAEALEKGWRASD